MGQRVFFKRKALMLLRGYWCRRWDNLELKQCLSLSYEPKYHVESVHLDGFYWRLRGLDFVWHRGLFTVGRHLESGRYFRFPVQLPLLGLGPRQVVFPSSLLEHMSSLTLLGGWMRYQLCRNDSIDPPALEAWSRRHEETAEPLQLKVSRLTRMLPRPLMSRHGTKQAVRETFCLEGRAINTQLAGAGLVVPISEVKWSALPGYEQRYLASGA